MPSVKLSPLGNLAQYFTDNNQPLNEGLLYTYEAGTVTPLSTYTTDAGNTPNTNPIELDAYGRPPHNIWLIVGESYDFILKDSDGNTIDQALDVTGVNDGGDITIVDLDVSGDTILGDSVTGGNTTVNLLTTGQEFTIVTLEGETLVVDADGNIVATIQPGDSFTFTGGGAISFDGVDVDMSNASSVNYLDGSITVPDLGADVISLIQSSAQSSSASGFVSGNGRLSLASGVRVMNQDYTAKTVAYYVATFISLNDGTGDFVGQEIVELSNTSTNNTRNPAAVAANKTYDGYVWAGASQSVTSITRSSSTATVTKNSHGYENGEMVYVLGAEQDEYNGPHIISNVAANTFDFTVEGTPATPATGTITMKGVFLTRSVPWRNAGQAITGATNATPIVITATAHGLLDGDDVTIENVGGNTAANGTWVVAGKTNDTFQLTGSIGNGAYTSGTGSLASIGVGVGTAERKQIGNVIVNKYAITNGPVAEMGTFVGSLHANGSSQWDWKLGGTAAGGAPIWLAVWNISNQANIQAANVEGTTLWTVPAGSATFEELNESTNNRAYILRGMNGSGFTAQLFSAVTPRSSGTGDATGAGVSLAIDSVTATAPGNQGSVTSVGNATTSFNGPLISTWKGNTLLGWKFFQAMQENSAAIPANTGGSTFQGFNSGGSHPNINSTVLFIDTFM